MKDEPDFPTPEQCSANERVADVWDRPAYACWYPQMGGYVSRCVVVLGQTVQDSDGHNNCFEAFVWHDGQFPFHDDGYGCTTSPANIHHCAPSQFIDFGKLVLKLQGVTDLSDYLTDEGE
jgi:hypothetical protein